MTHGNWRLGVFVDEKATDAQFERLVQVFTGQLGGPMAALAPLVGTVLGVERAAIQVSDAGLRHRVQVSDVIDFEIEDIIPFGVPTGRPIRFDGMFHPVAANLTMAEARHSRINAFGRASRLRSSPGRCEAAARTRQAAATPVRTAAVNQRSSRMISSLGRTSPKIL
jgi:hypothetical protein